MKRPIGLFFCIIDILGTYISVGTISEYNFILEDIVKEMLRLKDKLAILVLTYSTKVLFEHNS